MGDLPVLLKFVPPALGPEMGPAAHCKGEREGFSSAGQSSAFCLQQL